MLKCSFGQYSTGAGSGSIAVLASIMHGLAQQLEMSCSAVHFSMLRYAWTPMHSFLVVMQKEHNRAVPTREIHLFCQRSQVLRMVFGLLWLSSSLA